MTGINDVELLAQANDPYDLFAFKINYIDVEESGMNGVQPLYNGNISETFWRSSSDNVKRAYGYTYDDLNRMDEAFYVKTGFTTGTINNYREKATYDENGNILSMKRNGNLDNGYQEIEIDDLTYTYQTNSNLLVKVTDATLHPMGFKDDSADGTVTTDTSDDYRYDLMGNMISDENKSILEISYNHLNLPTYIDIENKGTILYFYDATGRKVRKLVQDNVLTQSKVVEYADGFQYENNIVQFFPTAEGYASRLTTKIEQSGQLIKIPIEELPEDQFSYVYNYTDHLGNIRLSYSLDPETQQLKIVEQNHYYPFGMRHTNYSGGKMVIVKDEEIKRMAPATEEFLTYKYKYNGKEYQDELGLNMYDYGARNYDAAIGRWMNVDKLSEKYYDFSPYLYTANNPVLFVDFDGNDYGVLVNNTSRTITVSATYMVKASDQAAFNKNGRDAFNNTSGQRVFVPGGVKALKEGKSQAYKINFDIQSQTDNSSPGTSHDAIDEDHTGTINLFETRTSPYAGLANENGITINDKIVVRDSMVDTSTTTHEVAHSLGVVHSDSGGALPTQGISINNNLVEEILAGAGIGGNNIVRNSQGKNSGAGDATLLNGSTNQGLENGQVISARRYDRIMKRIERREARKARREQNN